MESQIMKIIIALEPLKNKVTEQKEKLNDIKAKLEE